MLHHNFFWTGCLRVRITGDSCERFLNLCVNHEIPFCEICRDQDCYTAIMMAGDFLKIKRLVKKSGVHICIVQKSGMPFFLKQHRKRKLLLLGWIWCCFFLYLLSIHIWRIDICGNQEVTTMQMLSYLEQNEIRPGSLSRKIDCKKIAADIRNAFPGITWVAVKKQGTLLEINIKENTDSAYTMDQGVRFSDSEGSSLASVCDGRILDIVTREGVTCVQEGDQIRKGDILVSGAIPVTNDDGEITNIRYVNADADILIETSGTYTDTFPRSGQQDTYPDQGQVNWYLKIGNQIFSTGKIRETSETSDLMVEETQLSLFPGFYLPVCLGKVICHEVESHSIFLSEEAAKEKAERRLEKFITENAEKGVQIFKKNVKIETGMTICKCVCNYQAYISETRSIPATQVEDNEERTNS